MRNIITPEPPYIAVIFTSQRTSEDLGYNTMGSIIEREVSTQPGYLGAESMRNEHGFGITISYWESQESIDHWKTNIRHMAAKKKGKELWYAHYTIRISQVDYDHSFEKNKS